MPIVDCIQGSAGWLHTRVGRITASRVCEALSKYKDVKKANIDNADRYNYKIDLIVERMTGRSTENFTTPEMQWGRDHEEEASQAYEMENNVLAEKVGFIIHPRFDWMGASPDSLVGDDGGHEIKCPKSATHLKWYFQHIKQGIVPPEHQPQVLCNIACAERDWWDFSTYDPRMKNGLRLFTVRMHRDEKRIKEMEDEAERFNAEVDAIIAELSPRIKNVPAMPPAVRESAPESMSAWAEQFESEYGETAI